MAALPRWQPDPETRTIGERARVAYTNAPKGAQVPAQYRHADTAQLPIDPRTRVVREAAKTREDFLRPADGTSTGGRRVARGDEERLDMHQAGRAVDLMIPRDHRAAGGRGDALANWLVRNAEQFQLQFVTWKGTNWSAGRGGAGRWYARGSDDHDNHIHVEVMGPQGFISEATSRGSGGNAVPGAIVALSIIAAVVTAGFLAWRLFT